MNLYKPPQAPGPQAGQALIFATLAAYYIGEAVHEEHH